MTDSGKVDNAVLFPLSQTIENSLTKCCTSKGLSENIDGVKRTVVGAV